MPFEIIWPRAPHGYSSFNLDTFSPLTPFPLPVGQFESDAEQLEAFGWPA